jgi:hypothetical protein
MLSRANQSKTLAISMVNLAHLVVASPPPTLRLGSATVCKKDTQAPMFG